MRIVFVLGGRVFFRFIDGVVRELDADGHQVEVRVPVSPSVAIERCRDECRSLAVVTYGEEPYVLKRLVTHVRLLRGYRHWLAPEHRWPEFLRRRWATTELGFPRALRGAVSLLGLERFDRLITALPTRRVLAALERRIPPNPRVAAALRKSAPDLVVATPFVYPSPRQHTTEVEHVKAARRLGIPTAVMVASWDNLSMKGVFYVEPDLVLVWNEIQRREAGDFHHLASDKVVATGAPLFDAWFERRYELPREELLRRAGLAGDYVLYVESSAASGDEWGLVHRSAEALDAAGADPALRVMVRRHPSRRDVWRPLEHPRLKLFPDQSSVPDTTEGRTEFYNSIRHARAVVGVNTTVFLEAAILDRPCVALLDPEKDYFQAGLVHFQYLLDADFLELAASPEEAAERLLAIAVGADRKRNERQAFVRSFVRPVDDGRSASRVTADALVAFVSNGCGTLVAPAPEV